MGQSEHTGQRTNIAGFNGIRALAVATVVLTHLDLLHHPKVDAAISSGLLFAIEGVAGVQIFFALSGFLITHLLLVESRETGTISLKNFYVRRCLRIFPIYFLVVLLVAVTAAVGKNVAGAPSIAFAFGYGTNFIPRPWYAPILGHTWSLAVEEHFYLVWPFVVLIAAAQPFRLVRWLLFFIVASVLLSAVLLSIPLLTKYFFVERWTPIAGLNIAIGCLLAVLLSPGDHQKRSRALIGHFVIGLTATAAWIGAGFLDAPEWTQAMVRGVGLAMIVGWIYCNQRSLIVRLLEVRPLPYLGMVSYGIYMYQGFYLSTGPNRIAGQTWPPDQVTGLILLAITVPLSYHFLEKPLLRLKHKWHSQGNSSQELRFPSSARQPEPTAAN